MKSAENLVVEFMLFCQANPADIQRLKQTEQFKASVKFWQKELLESKEAGMREAAEIASKRYDDPAWNGMYQNAGQTIGEAILTAADKLKEIKK